MSAAAWVAWIMGHALAAVVLHEAAHALVGTLLGGRVVAAGWLSRASGADDDVMMRGVGVKLMPPRGAAAWSPGAWALVVAAGLVCNVATGVVMWLTDDGAWKVAGLVHGACALANLLPPGRAGPPSDGQQLWRWFVSR